MFDISRLPGRLRYFSFLAWYRDYAFKIADEKIEPFICHSIEAESKGAWLRLARRALFISTGQMAERLSISRSAYCQIEKSEDAGAITILKLRQVADKMDCELVYAIRPKRNKIFSEVIWEQVEKIAEAHPRIGRGLPSARSYRIAARATDLMRDFKFRVTHKWSRRKNPRERDMINE